MRLRLMAPLGALLMLGTIVTSSIHALPQQDSSAAAVTFNKDVLPILQKNCQACHRPGEIAPMSFLTYKDARPWAKAIKAAVVEAADAAVVRGSGVRPLRQRQAAERRRDRDARRVGRRRRRRKATRRTSRRRSRFQDGWNIKPDMIIEMPKDFNVPATGTINYQNILVKVNFPEDVWVVAAEMRPGNPQVLHHGRVLVRPPGSELMKDAVPGEAYETGESSACRKGEAPETLGKFNPGTGRAGFQSVRLGEVRAEGIGPRLQSCTTRRSERRRPIDPRVGLVFAKKPPKLRYFMHNGPTASNLAIPAGDGNAEIVSEMTTNVDTKLVYMQPHMHLRGKDYELRLVYPVRQDGDGVQGQVGLQLADGLRPRQADSRCRKARASSASRTTTTPPTTSSIPIRTR